MIEKSYECDEKTYETTFYESVNHKDHESSRGGMESLKPARDAAIDCYKDFDFYTQQEVYTIYNTFNTEIMKFNSIIADISLKIDDVLVLLENSYKIEDESIEEIPESFRRAREDLVNALIRDTAIYDDTGAINHFILINRASKAANPKYPHYVVDVYNVLSREFAPNILSTDLEPRYPVGSYSDIRSDVENFNTFTFRIYNAYSALLTAIDDLENPTEPTEPEPTEPTGSILYGDADGDGELTDYDVVLLKRYLANWDVELGWKAKSE